MTHQPLSTPDTALATQALPHVLVVEDDRVNCILAEILLKKLGCRTTLCENGQLAVDLVQRGKFDLILMDVNMPVMDGLTATRAIRALSDEMARVPIFVLSADIMNDAPGRALAAGATAFFGKPLLYGELRLAIQTALPGLSLGHLAMSSDQTAEDGEPTCKTPNNHF
jgi:CheY-like chemotaxis protein